MQNLPPHLMSQSHMQGMPPREEEMMNPMSGMGEKSEKIVAHFDRDELTDLNELMTQFFPELQGHPLIDPETGLNDYSPLEKPLRNPEIHNAIFEALSPERQRFAEGGEVHEIGKPIDPELEHLRLEGRHGDTELAIITPYILKTFEEWSGKEVTTNPKTDLPEFGGKAGKIIKSAVRVVGTLLGPITGFVASKLTGQSTSAALKNAGIGAALAAAPFIGGSLGIAGLPSIPGIGAGAGGASGGAGFLSNLFSSSTGGGVVSPHAVVGANTVGKMLPASAFGQSMGHAGIQAAGQTGGGGFLGSFLGGSSGGGGMLSSMGQMLPIAGSALLMAKGHRDEQKGLRDYQRALESQQQREKQEAEAERERRGFNAKLNPVQPYRRRQIDPNLTHEEYLRGVEPRYFENYAEGGAIRGHGKGQQDNIPKSIKENSYIIDASTVSDIGDGSSEAGIKELDRYFGKIPSYGKPHEAKGGYIKAMVSNDEYEVPPEKVTALGRGSNERGAQILKKLVSQVRSQKRTSGRKLPPKAKPIGGYLSNMGHSGR